VHCKSFISTPTLCSLNANSTHFSEFVATKISPGISKYPLGECKIVPVQSFYPTPKGLLAHVDRAFGLLVF
jgi:hypothetical protein